VGEGVVAIAGGGSILCGAADSEGAAAVGGEDAVVSAFGATVNLISSSLTGSGVSWTAIVAAAGSGAAAFPGQPSFGGCVSLTAIVAAAGDGVSWTAIVAAAGGGVSWTAIVAAAGGGVSWTAIVAAAGGGVSWTAIVAAAGGGVSWTAIVAAAGGGVSWTAIVAAAAGGVSWTAIVAAAGGVSWTAIVAAAAGGVSWTAVVAAAAGGVSWTAVVAAAAGGVSWTAIVAAAGDGVSWTAIVAAAAGGVSWRATVADVSASLWKKANATTNTTTVSETNSSVINLSMRSLPAIEQASASQEPKLSEGGRQEIVRLFLSLGPVNWQIPVTLRPPSPPGQSFTCFHVFAANNEPVDAVDKRRSGKVSAKPRENHHLRDRPRAPPRASAAHVSVAEDV